MEGPHLMKIRVGLVTVRASMTRVSRVRPQDTELYRKILQILQVQKIRSAKKKKTIVADLHFSSLSSFLSLSRLSSLSLLLFLISFTSLLFHHYSFSPFFRISVFLFAVLSPFLLSFFFSLFSRTMTMIAHSVVDFAVLLWYVSCDACCG